MPIDPFAPTKMIASLQSSDRSVEFPEAFDSARHQNLSARFSNLLSGQAPIRVYLDYNVLLDPALGSGVIFPDIWQSPNAARFEVFMSRHLGALHEFGSRLYGVARSLNKDLAQADAAIHNGNLRLVIEAKYCRQIDISDQPGFEVCESMGPVAAKLDGQHILSSLQSDLWDYLQDALYRSRSILVQRLSVVKRARQRVRLAITALLKSLHPVRFFCSCCWERRIWFLRHGAHPAESSLLSSEALFFVACSAPSLAKILQ